MATSALSFSPSSNPRLLPVLPRPAKVASFSSRAASFPISSSASPPLDAEDLTAAASSASPSSSCSPSLASASVTGRRIVLGAGISLLTSAAVASDASATRIEYYATVGDPLCDLSYARSGLGYCDVSVGKGPEPPRGELINIHYTARFADGTVFDSSYKRGRPLTLRIGVGKVLPGLDQGILGGGGVPPMLVGGKRKLLIPSKLAYGPEPAGCFSGDCNIPGNATLLYDILFVGIYK